MAEEAMAAAEWEDGRRRKAEIVRHAMYHQLLEAHVACLRTATPLDQLPSIDAQLSLSPSHHLFSKYSIFANDIDFHRQDLDPFMTHYILLLCSFKEQLQQHVRVHAMEATHYILLLCSFKEQLQQHVRVHAMDAVTACWELEQSLKSLTGVSPGEGTGATMSDDDDEDQAESDSNLYDGSLDGSDSMGFGPLVPTDSEQYLMERVRLELKQELKQAYKEKLVDIREEILRKRSVGKLRNDNTSLLKAWWQSHSKWPYPTEDDKARLMQETGLQLKQINNWFINQRKRNWHSNSSSSAKSKRKR